MSRLLGFFSGFPNGFSPNVAAFLREHLAQRERLVFITSNPAGTKTDHYAAMMHGWFEEVSLPFARYHAIDDRIEPARAVQLTEGADCVFLMGGKTGLQMQFLRSFGLDEAICNSPAMVLGLSAGAINMAKISFDMEESLIPHEGLGLTDITIHPHFDSANEDELAKLQCVATQFPVYAMKDDSAIFVQGEHITCMGEIMKFERQKRFDDGNPSNFRKYA